MRSLRAIALLGLLLGALGPSIARAVVVPFTGTFDIQIGSVSTSFSGGGLATVNGSGAGGLVGSLALPAGVFSTVGLVTPVTDPSVSPIKGLQITAANSPGAFVKVGMGIALGGVMPILGESKVCLFGTCPNAVANLQVPLSVLGVGGGRFVTGPVNLTVYGAPWTTGTAVARSRSRQSSRVPA